MLMRSLLVACIALLAAAALAQETEHKKAGSHKTAANSKKQGTSANPLVVDILPPKDADKRAEEDQRDRDSKRMSDDAITKATTRIADYNDDLARYTGYLIVVGILQIFIFIAQLVYIGRQEIATRAISRAYIKMSHQSPGVKNIDLEKGRFLVTFSLKNWGETPGTLTDAMAHLVVVQKGEKPPLVPQYKRGGEAPDAPEAFLVKGEEISYTDAFEIPPADLLAAKEGTKVIWLFGFLDYIDQFGHRRRAGYGRFYNPALDDRSNFGDDQSFLRRSNLMFAPDGKYNYDRSRKKGEGKDWR